MKTTTQSVNRLQVLRVCTQNKREKKGWHVILPEKCNPMPWVCTIFHKKFSLHIIIITDTLDICLYHAISVQAFRDTTLYFKGSQSNGSPDQFMKPPPKYSEKNWRTTYYKDGWTPQSSSGTPHHVSKSLVCLPTSLQYWNPTRRMSWPLTLPDTKAQQKNKYFQWRQYFGQWLVNNIIFVAGLCTSLHQDCWFTPSTKKITSCACCK